MSKDGQVTKCRRNVAENFNRLSARALQTDRKTDRRQTTDRRTATAISEREREFTFDKQEGQHPLTVQRAPPISGGT